MCLKSGMGCRLAVPNTCSEAANLLAQSCVPDPNARRTPSAAAKEREPARAVELKALGLPVYMPMRSPPQRVWMSSSRSAMSRAASSQLTVSKRAGSSLPLTRFWGVFRRSGSWWISVKFRPLWQAKPLCTGWDLSGSNRTACVSSSTCANSAHVGSQIRQNV